MLTIRVESSPGTEFIDVFREMQAFAFKNDVIALQNVNGVQVMMFPDSIPEQILTKYLTARERNVKVVS
jgi:hypothetical protein